MTKISDTDTSSKQEPHVASTETHGDLLQRESRSLAAESARTSLKRARALFSSSCTVPSVDKAIHKLQVARRIRMNYPIVPLAPPTMEAAEGDDGNTIPYDAFPTLADSRASSSLTMEVLKEMREGVIADFRGDRKIKLGSGNSDVGGGQLTIHREVDVLSRQRGAADVGKYAEGSKVSSALALPGQKVAGNGKNEQTQGILVKVSLNVDQFRIFPIVYGT